MLLQERDRILEERHALLSFAKGGEGATSELCRQLEQIISEKQALGIENEKLRSENDELRKIKQQLIEERDAAQFRYVTFQMSFNKGLTKCWCIGGGKSTSV